jgi:hypothetical protein
MAAMIDPAPHAPDYFGPQHIDSVAGRNAEVKMRFVLEHGAWRRQHYVAQQNIFRMEPHGAVNCGDHRHFDVQDIHEDFSALAKDFIKSLRREKIKAIGAYRFHERITAPGENNDANYLCPGLFDRKGRRIAHACGR